MVGRSKLNTSGSLKRGLLTLEGVGRSLEAEPEPMVLHVEHTAREALPHSDQTTTDRNHLGLQCRRGRVRSLVDDRALAALLFGRIHTAQLASVGHAAKRAAQAAS